MTLQEHNNVRNIKRINAGILDNVGILNYDLFEHV